MRILCLTRLRSLPRSGNASSLRKKSCGVLDLQGSTAHGGWGASAGWGAGLCLRVEPFEILCWGHEGP